MRDSILQEEIVILNLYAPKNNLKIKQKNFQNYIEKKLSKITVGGGAWVA